MQELKRFYEFVTNLLCKCRTPIVYTYQEFDLKDLPRQSVQSVVITGYNADTGERWFSISVYYMYVYTRSVILHIIFYV